MPAASAPQPACRGFKAEFVGLEAASFILTKCSLPSGVLLKPERGHKCASSPLGRYVSSRVNWDEGIKSLLIHFREQSVPGLG